MRSPLIIAIDGPVGCREGNVARAVAARLRYRHVDTGAMYRAVAWKALHDGRRIFTTKRPSRALGERATFDLEAGRVVDRRSRRGACDSHARDRSRRRGRGAAARACARVLVARQRQIGRAGRRRHGRAGHRHGRLPRRRREDLSRRVAGGARQAPCERSGARRHRPSRAISRSRHRARRARPERLHSRRLPAGASGRCRPHRNDGPCRSKPSSSRSWRSCGAARLARNATRQRRKEPARRRIRVLRSLISFDLLAVLTAVAAAQRPLSAGLGQRQRQKFWPTGEARSTPASHRPRSRPRSGARRRTSAGRSSCPVAVSPRRSSGVTAFTSSRPCPARARAPARRGVHRFLVMALNRKDGKIAWQQTAQGRTAARRHAPGIRHDGVSLGADRRRASSSRRSSRAASMPTT